MSEKIYALLLRLYPSRFRDAYGDEALQLFRDRARDEKGLLSTLRLWLDLLADLAISIPRCYGDAQTELTGASAQRRLDGVPTFHVLGNESLPRRTLFLGGVLSLVSLAAVPVSISHFGSYRPPRASAIEPVGSTYARWSASSHPASQTADDVRDKPITFEQPASTATLLSPGDSRPNDFRSKPILDRAASGLPPPSAQPAKLQGAPSATIQTVVEKAKLDAVDRRRVIHAVIANVKEHYIDSAVAQKLADALLAHEKNRDYDGVTDGPAFADLLTTQMREVSYDMHLVLVYSQSPLPGRLTGPTPEGLARYRKAMLQENCTFEKVEILRHNVGYLKLNSFPDPSICLSSATAAMASLNHADAIIFDLRDNGGGYPKMVMLMAGYLFDHPEYLYNPRESVTRESWTQSPVPGNKLADKPVYLLTSARTASGAEQFSYNLKMLKRATLVGETTRGSAHSGVLHRIDEHFGIGIPEAKPINPFAKSDWEGTGVEPDVKVTAADALERAKKLAESQLSRK